MYYPAIFERFERGKAGLMNRQEIDYNNRNYRVQDQYTLPARAGQSETATILKRIGSTTYTVAIHFSNTSRETINDKVTRIIRREVESEASRQ